eukprot:CAMPEP_0202866812 /NCGR_PEP_ID=MMETSP1391-20130828/8375_1 /ASSEMBLY_ACC=CAM_ASM_000867 /TAXON_ID=1034604 /ORGANISM="Chlamydomonas leiostraca, Strain SAG 11-49" /LENGTH=152 /DNA_ID=CAMNT_0049546797 /DNA_START=95 /DNA_END=550 /DNA_ORIENTATION=+
MHTDTHDPFRQGLDKRADILKPNATSSSTPRHSPSQCTDAPPWCCCFLRLHSRPAHEVGGPHHHNRQDQSIVLPPAAAAWHHGTLSQGGQSPPGAGWRAGANTGQLHSRNVQPRPPCPAALKLARRPPCHKLGQTKPPSPAYACLGWAPQYV